MKANINCRFKDYLLFIGNSCVPNDVNIDDIIHKNYPTQIVYQNITDADLIWFDAVLDYILNCRSCKTLSFQGTIISEAAYKRVKAFQSQNPDIKLSFSVEIASNLILHDSEELARLDYSFGDVFVCPYNSRPITYGEFKRVLPCAKEIHNMMNTMGLYETLEKVLFVDNWMQQHVQYIKDSSFEVSGKKYIYPEIECEAVVTDVFLHNYGVCEDIAASITVLMSLAGIDSQVISRDGHAWNLVKMDDTWYIWDCTHNITRNTHKVTNELKASEYCANYLLRGSNFYKGDYYPLVNAFNEPVSKSDYPREKIMKCINRMKSDESIKTIFGNSVVFKNRGVE